MLYKVTLKNGEKLEGEFSTDSLFRALLCKRTWKKMHPKYQVKIERGSYYDNHKF